MLSALLTGVSELVGTSSFGLKKFQQPPMDYKEKNKMSKIKMSRLFTTNTHTTKRPIRYSMRQPSTLPKETNQNYDNNFLKTVY